LGTDVYQHMPILRPLKLDRHVSHKSLEESSPKFTNSCKKIYMSILYVYIVTVYFAFDKVLLKNFTTTTTALDTGKHRA